jgi:LAS superfamily LD-carboxypeptidase LdcB
MKKKILTIVLIISLLTIFGLILYDSVNNSLKVKTESTIDGQNITKEEYIYKEELLSLGYNSNIIKKIEEKISTINVKNYLLNKKYDYLEEFTSSPYFKIENIERYENYYKNNPSYTFDQVVLYVEIGLDYEFYTNVNTIEDYTSITTLVNKYNKLPDGATFDNLVTLEKPYSNTGKRKVREEMYEPLKQMIDDAKKEKLNLYVISAFRENSTQNYLFNNSKKKNGLDYALTYSAKPGHSEHELGLAIDFNTTQEKFKKTKEYAWLKDNSYKYGFVMRYPENKVFITGYGYEPWHYRYLGIEIATKMYLEDITYEEYLVKYKN